jgi:hypothetical protein
MRIGRRPALAPRLAYLTSKITPGRPAVATGVPTLLTYVKAAFAYAANSFFR